MNSSSLLKFPFLSALAGACLLFFSPGAAAIDKSAVKPAPAAEKQENAQAKPDARNPERDKKNSRKNQPGQAGQAIPKAGPKASPAGKTPEGSGTVITVSGKAQDEKVSREKAASRDEEYLKRLSAEVARITLERDKIVAENIIAKEKIIKELAAREAETERKDMEIDEAETELKRITAVQKAGLEKELTEMRAEKERLVLQSEIAKAKTEAELSKLKLLEEERKSRLSELNSAIEQKEKEFKANQYAERKPVYLEKPLQGKQIVVSDRRIALNGPIHSETADYISERINYFNNKDQKLPIFIVIDYSPGGSVMSGYKILKAMEGSEAPIHVIVKSFAASMAACITTLADTSYAYPNALVLHHQISGFAYGNLTQQREFVEEAEEWWRRLAGPVAKKMGIGLEEFIEQMYSNSSSGDWTEFADKARNLKWVDHIIEEVRETSLIKHPDAESDERQTESSTYHYGLQELRDKDGDPYVVLPRLAPFDYYWLYNPDSYYRMK